MDVELLRDPAVFAGRVGTWLRGEPLSANVLAVQLAGVLDRTRTAMPDSVWALATGPAGDVVGVAMHTDPVGVFLPRLAADVAAALADAFADTGRPLAGATGEAAAVRAFAAAWQRRTGSSSRQLTVTRLHRLGALVPPTGVPGRSRRAGPADLDLVAGWFRAFAVEADPVPPAGPAAGTTAADAVAASAAARVGNGETHLWVVDGEPVSVASVSPPGVGVSRVGPVFTPLPGRRHGYAAAVTAAAAGVARGRGAADVVLYTDLANPTAAGVYRRIGFRPELDSTRVAFEPAAPGPGAAG